MFVTGIRRKLCRDATVVLSRLLSVYVTCPYEPHPTCLLLLLLSPPLTTVLHLNWCRSCLSVLLLADSEPVHWPNHLPLSLRFPVWATASSPRLVFVRSTSPRPAPPFSRSQWSSRWTSPTPRAPALPRRTASTPSPSPCSQVRRPTCCTSQQNCWLLILQVRSFSGLIRIRLVKKSCVLHQLHKNSQWAVNYQLINQVI